MGDRKRIDRYLTEGLPPAEEDALRAHLGTCEACRAYYDAQVVLIRGLGGDPDQPGVGEEARLAGLVLRRAGLPPPAPVPKPDRGLLWRLLHPARPVLAFGLSGFGLLVVAAVLILALATESGPVARVNGARDLSVGDQSIDERTSRGLVIAAGQEIRVGAEGLAELKLDRGGLIRAYPGARLTIAGGGEEVALGAGRIWCLIEKGKGRFVVRTDRAEVTVIGTSFVVEHARTADQTEVRVMGGEVQVDDRAGHGQIRLTAGQQTLVVRGEAPAPPKRYLARRDRADWDRFWNRFVQGWIRAGHKLKNLIESLD